MYGNKTTTPSHQEVIQLGKDFLVWMDMEMTGLDATRDTVLEVAVMLSDAELEHVVEGPHLVIYHSEDKLEAMNAWCQNTFKKNGLWNRVLQSPIKSSEEADCIVSEFIRSVLQILYPTTSQDFSYKPVLCGNSIHADKKFVDAYFPKLSALLHYRLIDVSTLKELARRWSPSVLQNAPVKKNLHTALDDIKESMEEMRYYRTNMLRDDHSAH